MKEISIYPLIRRSGVQVPQGPHKTKFGPVAQLGRAPDWQSGGRGFEALLCPPVMKHKNCF